ncbi:MAG TPA: DUF483 domain-containing protein [Archaeoglobaceae archaeon]|nr:DUF483 domain-containing protein [Archaeoglobaceae archaeon]
MDRSEKLFSILFDVSPTLFTEAGRIRAGTTNCVLLQQFFEEPSIIARELLSREIGSYDLKKTVRNVENQVKRRIKPTLPYKSLNKAGFEVLPSAMILNRISKPYFACEIFFYLCSKDKTKGVIKKLNRIKKIELNTLNASNLYENPVQEDDLIKSIIKINRIEGELLGYPECCISEFVKDKAEGKHHETKIAMECLQIDEFEVAIDCFLNPDKVKETEFPDFFYSHFTQNFYPCSIYCKDAVKIGKTNEEYFGRLRKLYGGRIVLNVLYHLATSYVSYKIMIERNLGINTEYRKFISDYFNGMDSELLSIVDKVKDLLIYSTNELGDVYLRKILMG